MFIVFMEIIRLVNQIISSAYKNRNGTWFERLTIYAFIEINTINMENFHPKQYRWFLVNPRFQRQVAVTSVS